ncbi:MAG TPA: adenylate/guanylate cyclase domain-containing protein, partial [Vicinamibacteria bacterium]|nr:adenylate/guanylate cyclase domain-containing protein [Vicinamibacteria bacterium]
QVRFESEEARERARTRLLNAARKYRIVPVGFVTGQLRSERGHAAAGRLVIELGRNPAPGELEPRLRTVLRDPTLLVLHWSDAAGAYLDGAGRPVALPAEGRRRAVTYLERQGRPMTALVHDPAILEDRDVADTVLAAVRFVVEKERGHGAIPATATAAAALPTGFLTLLMTDIEASTALLRQLGDRYATVLGEVRAVLRGEVSRGGGREIDARADECFAVFETPAAALAAAVAVQRALGARAWTDDLKVRVRIGLHSGRPTLTEAGYIGLAVHTTARVCAAAHGGQILASAATRAAVGDAVPGLRFRSIGRHRLAGLPGAEALFQVLAAGLPATFPPPRTGRRATPPRVEPSPRPAGRQLELPQPPG